MSDIKENDEQLVNTENEGVSKAKLIIFYGATVGILLLIVILMLVIAVKFGVSTSAITAKYEVEEGDLSAILINPQYLEKIDSIEVDGQKIDKKETYSFNSKGQHTVKFNFKDSYESAEDMFKNSTKRIVLYKI